MITTLRALLGALRALPAGAGALEPLPADHPEVVALLARLPGLPDAQVILPEPPRQNVPLSWDRQRELAHARRHLPTPPEVPRRAALATSPLRLDPLSPADAPPRKLRVTLADVLPRDGGDLPGEPPPDPASYAFPGLPEAHARLLERFGMGEIPLEKEPADLAGFPGAPPARNPDRELAEAFRRGSSTVDGLTAAEIMADPEGFGQHLADRLAGNGGLLEVRRADGKTEILSGAQVVGEASGFKVSLGGRELENTALSYKEGTDQGEASGTSAGPIPEPEQ